MKLLERRVAGVRDMPVHELGQPRVADIGSLGDVLPVPTLGFQKGADFGVEACHAAILVKYSSESKEHFTSRLSHPRWVPGKHINQVVADNLAYWMGEAKMTQQALADKAGISQKTVSNYLNPDQRAEGAKGKAPSPKLTELALIADALHIQVWQLTREMSAKERALYEAIERAYQDLLTSAKT